MVEVHRGFRDEVEHRRGVDRHAQCLVGRGVDFGGRQATQVAEAITEAATDRHHQLDVTQAILVADQVRAALGQTFQQRRGQAADVTVVDHHADVDRFAHGFNVGGNAVLASFSQVVRQQQQALGAQALGFLCVFNGLTGRTAHAGQDWHAGGASVDRRLDDFRIFAGRQREELTGAACGEQSRGAVWGQPFQTLDVTRAVEVALCIEIGNRERQQTGREDGLQFLWIHYSNTLDCDVV
ncbi:hypothetical protein D3C73_922930 [compost metagenome]